MVLKILILGISVVLMAVVAFLAVAGILWALDLPTPPPVGGRVVLGVSAVAAVACIWRLWSTRRDHLA